MDGDEKTGNFALKVDLQGDNSEDIPQKMLSRRTTKYESIKLNKLTEIGDILAYFGEKQLRIKTKVLFPTKEIYRLVCATAQCDIKVLMKRINSVWTVRGSAQIENHYHGERKTQQGVKIKMSDSELELALKLKAAGITTKDCFSDMKKNGFLKDVTRGQFTNKLKKNKPPVVPLSSD
uniref:LAGLIDADG_2 domain-containing protein n=1 Tax=Rhabditophanes sp. KR3021 TaxID=114890 RepID=A0AC35TTC4_9BILA